MKKFMIRSLLLVCVASLAVLACSQNIFDFGTAEEQKVVPHFDSNGYWKTPDFVVRKNSDGTYSFYGADSLYGAYLAGRVAHLRQDFGNAAEYYKIAMEKDTSNKQLNSTVYIILSSLGQIDAAAPYARKEMAESKTESIAPLIAAIKDFADGKYAVARSEVNMIKDKTHTSLINPMFDAWTYAGEKNEKQAIASIDKIKSDPALDTTKLFHKGMIYDYLGNKAKADEMYSAIIRDHYQNVTYRLLEVITDFYARNGDKETARKIFGRYNDDSMLSVLLKSIDKRIESSDKNSAAVINTPQKGLAEALFGIGTLFRAAPGGLEFAEIYIAAAAYLNPDYDISKVALANIFEEQGLLKEANNYYAQVGKDSGSYFIARVKIIENLNTLEDYDAAEKELGKLLKEYPHNTQLLNDMGTIYAGKNDYEKAAEYYSEAIKSAGTESDDLWPVYYALAVSYDETGKKAEAEKYLQKALKMSRQDPNILNYLGYSWLEQGRNIDKAAKMIAAAYRKYPYEGHIADSMGWLYFKLGMYQKAVKFLEQATAVNPGNAVINEHLGDAYWFAGRKNEAVFQWRHALDLKEDAESIDRKAVENKIENGPGGNVVYKITDPQLLKELEEIQLPEEKQFTEDIAG